MGPNGAEIFDNPLQMTHGKPHPPWASPTYGLFCRIIGTSCIATLNDLTYTTVDNGSQLSIIASFIDVSRAMNIDLGYVEMLLGINPELNILKGF